MSETRSEGQPGPEEAASGARQRAKTLRKLGKREARSISAIRNAICAGTTSVAQDCSRICCSSTSLSNGWWSVRLPPVSSQSTRDEVMPANDVGANADISVEPGCNSLWSDNV